MGFFFIFIDGFLSSFIYKENIFSTKSIVFIVKVLYIMDDRMPRQIIRNES